MKAYFLLQTKRVLRILPLLVCVVLALFVGFNAVFCALMGNEAASEENRRFSVALVGSAEENMLQAGMIVFQSFDDSRFALEILEMEEHEAIHALEQREIAAYVRIPQDFIERSLVGDLEPLQFVSVYGNAGLIPLFREELTTAISDILWASQKGTYGSRDIFRDHGINVDYWKMMNEASASYVGLVMLRNQMYTLDILGIADAVDFSAYMFCGIAVLLLFLISLPFAVVFIRKDPALGRMLASQGCGGIRQAGAEFLSLLCGMTVLYLTVAAALFLQGGEGLSGVISVASEVSLLVRALPVIFAVSAFAYLIFELARDMVSGVLLHFFLSVSLCYLCGCLYPISAFPEGIQRLSSVLPMGLARSHLACCVTDLPSQGAGPSLLLYAAAFFLAAVLLRCRALERRQG